MTFRKLTPQQHATLRALRALGEMVVTPQDARPLRALAARGLVRYSRADGVRVASLRDRKAERAEARDRRAVREWQRWNLTQADRNTITKGD